jgi:hypothetical protein
MNPIQMEIEYHNTNLLQTVVRSSITLPPVMAIWRYPNNIHDGSSSIAALLVSQRLPNHQGIWKLNLMPHTREYLWQGTLVQSSHDEWFRNTQHKILLEAYSDTGIHPPRLYESIIQYNNHKIILPHRTIPVVRVHHDVRILNPKYRYLSRNENEAYRFEMKLGHLNPHPAPPTISSSAILAIEAEAEAEYQQLVQSAQSTLRSVRSVQSVSTKAPNLLIQRIVNGFLEGMIAKGEQCPIEMEPLKKENACMTPCGHAMTYAPAKEWVRTAHSCPVCRAPLELEQMQCWTA